MENNVLNLIQKDYEIKVNATFIGLFLEFLELKYSLYKFEYRSVNNDFNLIKETIIKLNNMEKEDVLKSIEELELSRSNILDISSQIVKAIHILSKIDLKLNFHARLHTDAAEFKLLQLENIKFTILDLFKYFPNDKLLLMNNLITVFPLKMTTQLYLDYIKRSISHNLYLKPMSKPQIDSAVENYKFLFKDDVSSELSVYFTEGFNFIKETENIDFSVLTLEELKDYKDSLNDIINIVIKKYNLFDAFLSAINKLLVLLTNIYNENINILEDNIKLKDIYTKVKDSALNTNVEVYENIKQKLISDYQEIIKDFNVNLKEANKILTENKGHSILEKEKVYFTKYHICRIIDVLAKKELDKSLFEGTFIERYYSFKNVDESYINSKIDELIKFIDDTLATLKPEEKRSARIEFLKKIDCPLSEGEFFDYINNLLSGSFSELEKNRALFNFSNLLHKLDYKNVIKNKK